MQSFPLNQDATNIEVRDNVQLPSKFRIKSEMMLEMEKIEPEMFQIGKPADEENEEEPKLTREELIQRSRELRALRIKESQRSAKAHHQNKIKSKKYHRILKKEKMRQQIKEFELLQKTDPEAALRKIEQLDRSRIEERAMLRHRNTGTWAKNLQVRAKYDKDARKDLAEQIAISRSLTEKKNVEDSDDDQDDEIDEHNGDGDVDPFNPWIKVGNGSSNGTGKTNEIGEFLSGYRKYWQERNQNQQELSEYNASDPMTNDKPAENDASEESENEAVPNKKPITNKKVKKVSSNLKTGRKLKNGWIEEDMPDISNTNGKKKKVEKLDRKEQSAKKLKKEKKKKKTPVVENIDDLFDDAEDVMREKYKKKYEKLQSELTSKTNKKRGKKEDIDEDEETENSQHIDLSFKKQAKRPELDEALNGDDVDADENPLSKQITKTLNAIASNGRSGSHSNNETATNYESTNINPDDIAQIKPQHLSTALPDTIYSVADDAFNEYDEDYHFDEEKKLTIAEAFEDDDIVAEFRREKDDEAKKNGPQEIDLSLPGWGSWGGSGIDPNKQKTKRKLVLREYFQPYLYTFKCSHTRIY